MTSFVSTKTYKPGIIIEAKKVAFGAVLSTETLVDLVEFGRQQTILDSICIRVTAFYKDRIES